MPEDDFKKSVLAFLARIDERLGKIEKLVDQVDERLWRGEDG